MIEAVSFDLPYSAGKIEMAWWAPLWFTAPQNATRLHVAGNDSPGWVSPRPEVEIIRGRGEIVLKPAQKGRGRILMEHPHDGRMIHATLDFLVKPGEDETRVVLHVELALYMGKGPKKGDYIRTEKSAAEAVIGGEDKGFFYLKSLAPGEAMAAIDTKTQEGEK